MCAVGKRLNVRTVLIGSIRRDGNEVRITAQPINAADGYHLWSDRNFAWYVATPLLSRDPRTQVDVYRLRRAVSSS
jgi:hypothetical protein